MSYFPGGYGPTGGNNGYGNGYGYNGYGYNGYGNSNDNSNSNDNNNNNNDNNNNNNYTPSSIPTSSDGSSSHPTLSSISTTKTQQTPTASPTISLPTVSSSSNTTGSPLFAPGSDGAAQDPNSVANDLVIVIGSIIGALTLMAFAFLCWRHRRSRKYRVVAETRGKPNDPQVTLDQILGLRSHDYLHDPYDPTLSGSTAAVSTVPATQSRSESVVTQNVPQGISRNSDPNSAGARVMSRRAPLVVPTPIAAGSVRKVNISQLDAYVSGLDNIQNLGSSDAFPESQQNYTDSSNATVFSDKNYTGLDYAIPQQTKASLKRNIYRQSRDDSSPARQERSSTRLRREMYHKQNDSVSSDQDGDKTPTGRRSRVASISSESEYPARYAVAEQMAYPPVQPISTTQSHDLQQESQHIPKHDLFADYQESPPYVVSDSPQPYIGTTSPRGRSPERSLGGGDKHSGSENSHAATTTTTTTVNIPPTFPMGKPGNGPFLDHLEEEFGFK